jgi:hypothetical protein
MSNVLSEREKQQVLALGRLGWSLRRIQQEAVWPTSIDPAKARAGRRKARNKTAENLIFQFQLG